MENLRVVDGGYFLHDLGERVILCGLSIEVANREQIVIPEGVTTLRWTSLCPFECAEDAAEMRLPRRQLPQSERAQRTVTLPTTLRDADGRMLGGAPVERFEVADGSPYLRAVDGVLYSHDGRRLLAYPIGREDTSFTVPEGVTEIAEAAFSYASLREVILPDSLLAVGAEAFASSALISIALPQRVERVGDAAFCGCRALEAVILSPDLTYMGEEVFRDCTALRELDLPDSMEYVPPYLCTGGTSLIRVGLGERVTAICEGAFCGCTALRELCVPEAVREMDGAAFLGCISLCLRLPRHLSHLAPLRDAHRVEIY